MMGLEVKAKKAAIEGQEKTNEGIEIENQIKKGEDTAGRGQLQIGKLGEEVKNLEADTALKNEMKNTQVNKTEFEKWKAEMEELSVKWGKKYELTPHDSTFIKTMKVQGKEIADLKPEDQGWMEAIMKGIYEKEEERKFKEEYYWDADAKTWKAKKPKMYKNPDQPNKVD